MIHARRFATLALAALVVAAPAYAQTYSQPANSNDAESAPTRKPADGSEVPSANSVDETGTFSVNPALEADPAMRSGGKVGPSRTDMNTESDTTASMPASAERADAGAGNADDPTATSPAPQ